MSSQVSPLEKVYTGLWTDWTHGRAQGLTLTVPSSHGALLIAFLAIFVRVAGGHLWDIFCYILFHVRASTDAQDGLHHQQQVLLRNNLSDNRAIWQFLAIAWEWRGKTRRPISRAAPLALCALLHFIAFSVAGIFSSKVVQVRSTVLMHGPTCGSWNTNAYNAYNKSFFTMESEMDVWLVSNWKTTSAYAKACYAFNDTRTPSLPDCAPYGRALIPWTVKGLDTCPFADGMCIDDLAVRLDSGYIDSHMHLGINAKVEDRIQIRHVMDCAPIKTDGFTTEISKFSETTLPTEYATDSYNAAWTGYKYGSNNVMDSNYTYVYWNTTAGYTVGDLQAASFLVDAENNYANDEAAVESGDSSFNPIAELQQEDADVFLFFITTNKNGGLTYIDAVHDPIFRADVPLSRQYTNEDGSFSNFTYYSSNDPVGVLGCSRQVQWCNPNTANVTSEDHKCTALNGTNNVKVDNMGMNDRQVVLANRLWFDMQYNTMDMMTIALGNEGLLASSATGLGQLGTTLPDDQWIRELDHWFGIMLTTLQLEAVQYAVGTGVESFDRYRVKPTSDDEKWMCSTQMVQRDDYSSFHMLGVFLILCLGTVFIIVNATLEPLIAHLRSTKGKLETTWKSHHVLQLQSMLFERLGMGSWNRDALVPVTISRSRFGLPSILSKDDQSYSQISSEELDSSKREHDYSKTASLKGAYVLDGPSGVPMPPLEWSNEISSPVEQGFRIQRKPLAQRDDHIV